MLIESEDKGFLDALQVVLSHRCIESHVVSCGSNSEGVPIFTLDALLVHQEGRAKDLLLCDYGLLNDIAPVDYRNQLLSYRAANLISVGSLLSSDLVKKLSFIAFIAFIVIGVFQWLVN